MKKLLLSVGIFLGVVAIFYSCRGNDVPEIKKPTELTVSDIGTNTATLSWNGDADSYEVMVGEQTTAVTDKTYTATGLTADTPYTWKVRAQEGNVISEWVDGPGFTTLSATPDGLEVTGFHVPGFIEFYGDYYSPGMANNFVVAIFQEGIMDWATGTVIYMDIFTSLSATTEILAGTYKISASYAPGTISDESMYETYESGEPVAEAEFVSGSATISVASGVYTIDFSLTGDDGVRVWGTYVGTLEYYDYSDEMEDQGAPSMQRTPWTFGGGKIMPHRK